MTPKEALACFKKKHPDLVFKQMLDYDERYYVIEALPPGEKTSFNDPYYGVEKATGVVSYYSPGGEFEKFFDALENRRIEV